MALGMLPPRFPSNTDATTVTVAIVRKEWPHLPHPCPMGGWGEGGIRHSWMLKPRASLLHPEPWAGMGARREQRHHSGTLSLSRPPSVVSRDLPSILCDFICYLGFWQEPAQLETPTSLSPSHLTYPSSY